MGRQHTTWISDETWRKLENIKGDSVSQKIRNAIEQVDPDREMVLKAELRRLNRLVEAMKRINDLVLKSSSDMNVHEILGRIQGVADGVEFCWRD
jgi:nitrogen-specific signal transduction histidine kinase